MEIDRFVTVLADTKPALDAHYRLRYRVFCEETGFEDPARFPDQRETDRYDASADHFLVWDRLDERWVGAMRLIDASRSRIPMEEVHPLPLKGLDANRMNSVELSRLCILNEYRGIPSSTGSDVMKPAGAGANGQKKAFLRQRRNEVLLRLLYAVFVRGQDQSSSYCYSIATAPLVRILERLGMPLERAGREVRHRGIRIPYRCHLPEAVDGMISTLPAFADLVANTSAYAPHSEIMPGPAFGLPAKLPASTPSSARKMSVQLQAAALTAPVAPVQKY